MAVVTVTLNPCLDKTFSVARVVPDKKLSARNIHLYPGGGGLNVARVISRLGTPVRALWTNGGDTGRRLGELLDVENLTHEPIPAEEPVRENLIIWDESANNQYRFGMPGPKLSEAELDHWFQHIQRVPLSTRYLVFSGSLPGQMRCERFKDFIRAVPDGVRVVLDTKDEALRAALEVGVFLVKPNVGELEDLVGRELGNATAIGLAAQEIVDGGAAEAVVVSLGHEGALLVTRNGRETVPAPPVRVRSKVGAGDSMVAGLVVALAQNKSFSEAVKLGVAAGTAAVITEGTDLCLREDVDRLYENMQRQELADRRESF